MGVPLSGYPMRFDLLILLALFGCNGDTGLNPDESDTDTDTDTDADTDTDGDTDPDTDTDTDTDPPLPSVRFIAIGDAGTGSNDQYAVADVIEQVCDRPDRGCDFALYLGDNVYDTGVSSDNDAMFQSHFELPYANLHFPFYVVLGNHDLGGDGLGIDLDPNKASYQVAYSAYSDKWDMESPYYTLPDYKVPHQPARFFALNTTDIFFGFDDDQRTWLSGETAASTSTWNIGFGHHPYVSNGQHGDAGEYEGIAPWVPFTAIPRGEYVKEFIEDEMCDGSIDVYFSGHDHNRQWLGQAAGCDTYFIVSGAGAKTTDFRHDGNATDFQDDQLEGFVWVEIVDNELTAYFYDITGAEVGPFTITK